LPLFDGNEEIRIIEKSKCPEEREVIPQIVWLYWHEEKLPIFIQKIIEHNKRKLPGYDFRLLNQVTVGDYLPEIVFKHKMQVSHMADVIRLELLYKYGGIWMDATVILRENLTWLEELRTMKRYDLIAYYREKSTVDLDYPVVESWFLASPPKTGFMKAWNSEFGKVKEIGYRYYDELTKRTDYEIVSQKIERPAYLMINLAEQIVSRSLGVNAYLKKSEDSALLVQEHLGWDNYAVNYVFTQIESSLEQLPIIKLTSGDRMLADTMYKCGLLKKRSLLGEIIYS
jgi:Mannosyltransferase OCH1 and related enzymes